MRRAWGCLVVGAALAAAPSSAQTSEGELKIEIYAPADGQFFSDTEAWASVEGMASVFGGTKYLDLFLVLDTSGSLKKSDPENYRSAGAASLVENFSPKSDIHIGVVDVDDEAALAAALTPDRAAVAATLRNLDQKGGTNLAKGILAAVEGFRSGARPESTRIILLFSDGTSNAAKAREAAETARQEGIIIHTLQLGERERGQALLSEVASLTGGSHVEVSDPAKLPEAFLALRTTGVERVSLSAGGSPATHEAVLSGGDFSGRVPLAVGENVVTATATSLNGRTASASVTVVRAGPLTVKIDSPANGTLFTAVEEKTLVKGSATMFPGLAALPAAFPGGGVSKVSLYANGKGPHEAFLKDGKFVGGVPLAVGENVITALAVDAKSRVAEARASVTVRPPGCGELHVMAERGGAPALSLSSRAVEIIFDASGSMWGQMDGIAKITTAKDVLLQALDWLDPGLALALRVYGHQHPREKKDCDDTELVVPPAIGNHAAVRDAVARFQPKGLTPIARSLDLARDDLAPFTGEKSVILLTDGIESCDGDPAAAAKALQEGGQPVPVHVIGFGMGQADAADLASLEAIAKASGGIFLAARDAGALRDALAQTVGTPFRVMRGEEVMASGALGTKTRFSLKPGDYVVRLDGIPPREAAVTIGAQESVTLILRRAEDGAEAEALRQPLDAYAPCP